MVRARPLALFAVMILALALVTPACSGGGDDDDDGGTTPATVTPIPDPTPIPGSVVEVEPNEEPEEATVVSGSSATLAFHGRCGQTGDKDWFVFVLGSGGFTGTLTWDERTYIPAPHIANDLDVYVNDSSGQIAADSALSPNDSPAEVSAVLDSAGAIHLLVDCFQSDDDLFYQGTLTP